jgi:hypothetical protein
MLDAEGIETDGGDRASIAEVVVRLRRRKYERTLSGGEERLLANAEQLLGEPPDDGLASDRVPRSPIPPSLSAGAAAEAPPADC